MSFYSRHILPWLIDISMGARSLREERVRTLKDVRGEVLEIGFGTGRNLAFYPPLVTRLTALDAEDMLPDKVAKRIATARFPIERVTLSAERLPFDDARFDWVVTTMTLCSIADAIAALREIRRVLKPAGSYVFLEHGRSDLESVARWQDRLNPLQNRIGGGCNINRRIDTLIRDAGLKVKSIARFNLGRPRIFTEMYRGVATP